MKRTLAALAAALFATSALAVTNPYTTDAGESESDNVVQVQLADAQDAGKGEKSEALYPQLG
jgi:hypothetical protein